MSTKQSKSQRNANRSDKAGVIVFARDAAVEHPPYDENIRIPETIETAIESDANEPSRGDQVGASCLAREYCRRIVIICDGNENIGDAREQARRLADAGVGIDVVPIDYQVRNEVAVEKITVPNDVNRGQPFELRVVLNNLTPRVAQDPQPEIKGKLRIVRKTNAGEQTSKKKRSASALASMFIPCAKKSMRPIFIPIRQISSPLIASKIP